MVLQNKYKARASRRYNAARGGPGDGRGRGRGSGRGGMNRRLDPSEFPSLPGQSNEEDEDEEGEGSSSDTSEETRIQRAKYAPRKLTSNSWRFEEPSEETEDGVKGEDEEEEPEPEVDLSGLLERVAKLDSSRTSKALSSEQAIQDALNADKSDIDSSLLYLLDRQKQRKADEVTNNADLPRHTLTEEQRKELEREGKRLQEDKIRQEKHERRARVLQQANQKTISLDIGNHRRAKEEGGVKKEGEKRRPARENQTSISYQSDEEENDQSSSLNPNQTDGDVDAFLSELNGVSKSASQDVLQADTTPSVSKNSSNPPKQNKVDDEDFLDSIL